MTHCREIQRQQGNWAAIVPAFNTTLGRCGCGQHTIGGNECKACERHPPANLQRLSVDGPQRQEVPGIVHEVLRSSGETLDTETRGFMEMRFHEEFNHAQGRIASRQSVPTSLTLGPARDLYEREADRVALQVAQESPGWSSGPAPRPKYDFSQVRVHTGPMADASARAINAIAYTVGEDVVFGDGQYRPRGAEGRRLIAHELAHVVQQSNGAGGRAQAFSAELSGNTVSIKPEKGDDDADLERVLCSNIKDRKIAHRKTIDVSDCMPAGTAKALEAGPYNCADFVRDALGDTPPKGGTPNLDRMLTPKLWDELLKKGARIRSFGVLKKDGTVEAATGLSWKQLNPRMGDLVFMKGEIIPNKKGGKPDPKGDTFKVTWDHVGIFIVRNRTGLDFHLAKDGDENPIDVYHTGSKPSEAPAGAYVAEDGVASLLAYVGLPDAEPKEGSKPPKSGQDKDKKKK